MFLASKVFSFSEPIICVLIILTIITAIKGLLLRFLFSVGNIGGVDMRVDVVDPTGRRRVANVDDMTQEDGRYKVSYVGSTKGKHKATVYLYGTPMTNDYVFRVVSPSPIERLSLSKLCTILVSMLSLSLSLTHTHRLRSCFYLLFMLYEKRISYFSIYCGLYG